MSYSCFDHLAHLPTLDVIAICARDTVDRAVFRAHAGFGTAGATDRLVLIGGVLAAAAVFSRLTAFLAVAGRIMLRACGPVLRRSKRPDLRTLVERRRGRPADVGVERRDPPEGDASGPITARSSQAGPTAPSLSPTFRRILGADRTPEWTDHA